MGVGSRLLALLLGVALSAALAELALRALRPARLAIVRYPCIYRPDATTGFRYVPGASGVVAAHFEIENRVEINSLGFYDDEPLPPGRARPRILAAGDSFTAAMNVARHETWTAVLESTLRRSGLPQADVVNLGIDGTGTDVHAALLGDFGRTLRPDAAILAFYANDVGDVRDGPFQRECYRGYVLSYPDPERREALRARVDAHLEGRLRRGLYAHSFLARLVANALLPAAHPYRMQFLQPRRSEIPERPPEAGRARWRAALSALAELRGRCACRLLVVPVPPRSDPGGSLRAWRRHGDRDFEVLDVAPALERLRRERGLSHEALYFRHDLHLNPTGNALFGRAIAEAWLANDRGS